MVSLCSRQVALYAFTIVLLSAIPTFSQSKACDLRLEVIQNPEPGDAREAPIKDALAIYYDKAALKTVPAQLKDGMPYFANLAEGEYRISVTKNGHKTTTKLVSIDCGLADDQGVISEIIFLWKGRSKDIRDMSTDPQNSGGKIIKLPLAKYPPSAIAGRPFGDVEVQITVDQKGDVIAARAIRGLTVFVQAALDAAFGIKFTPKIVQGQPVRFTKTFTYKFSAP